MRFLVPAVLDVFRHADEGVHPDVVDSPLEMQGQVLSLKTEELALLCYDADLPAASQEFAKTACDPSW